MKLSPLMQALLMSATGSSYVIPEKSGQARTLEALLNRDLIRLDKGIWVLTPKGIELYTEIWGARKLYACKLTEDAPVTIDGIDEPQMFPQYQKGMPWLFNEEDWNNGQLSEQFAYMRGKVELVKETTNAEWHALILQRKAEQEAANA